MTLVPLTIFVLVVVFALGGLVTFVTFLGNWLGDVWTYFVRWARHL